MTDSVAFADYLRDIYHQTCVIMTACERYSMDDFFRDEFCQNAFIRSLEVIGEAAKKVPFEFRDKYPEIQWRGMTGLRDVLIHGYGFVDTKQVWHIVTNLVPQLHEQIGRVLIDLG